MNVTWDLFWNRSQEGYYAWYTHTNNFAILQTNKLPHFDQTFSTLIEDSDMSSLLDETLVVVMSEMGRTLRINANAGRDHWTQSYSVVFAGVPGRSRLLRAARRSMAFCRGRGADVMTETKRMPSPIGRKSTANLFLFGQA